jgi:hypothetical protein
MVISTVRTGIPMMKGLAGTTANLQIKAQNAKADFITKKE